MDTGEATPAQQGETLKNMNASTAKYASWLVRVLDPKIVAYQFKARQEVVDAEKFECLLVSQNPKEYMMATVPFSFKDRSAAKKAMQKFVADTVWEVRNPTFDVKQKVEFISCPMKQVLVLAEPTRTQAVPPTKPEKQSYPSSSVDVGMDLSQVMEVLAEVRFDKPTPGPASGSLKPGTRYLDVCGKILDLSSQKRLAVAGRNRVVANLELVDDSGAKIEVSVWDAAYKLLAHIPVGEGVTLIGCTATREATATGAAIKLNLWGSAHVLRGGPRAQSLTSMTANQPSAYPTLTATFSPSPPSISVDAEAYPTCAEALAEAPTGTDKVFQINRCFLGAPTQEEGIFTRDGARLFVRCCLRDWTGCVEVDVVDDAGPALYGLLHKSAVEEHLAAGTLTSQLKRVNVRGVLRTEGDVVKKYVAKITPSPLNAKISGHAMRATLGLSDIGGDVVQAAPAERVRDVPMLGLAVLSESKGMISAHRVLLLVQGTADTKLDPIGEGTSLTDQVYRVTSPMARCLLSTSETHIDLHGYCDFNGILTYRLDKDVALVLVSAVGAGPVSDRPVFTVEHMQKPGEEDKHSLLQSLAVEWKTALTNESMADGSAYTSPQKAEYWEQPPSKLRRIESEAPSPKPGPP